jgi:AraC-like DNA-binding protein
LELFNKSLKISEECGFKENVPYVYLNIGGVYLSCSSMYGKQLFSDEMWEYLGKALDSGIETSQWDVVLVAFLNMGQFHFENPQNGKIKKAVERLKSACIPSDVALFPFTRRFADGMESYIEKDYESALKFFEETVGLIPPGAMHSHRLELMSLSAIGETQRAMGDYSAAIATIQSFLAKSRAVGASDEETRACRILADLYEKVGEMDKASRFQMEYLHKKDSTFSERDMIAMSKMPLVNELDEIKKSLEEERARKRRLVIIALVSGLFIVLLALYLFTLIRSRKKMRVYVKDLYRKNIELMKAEKRDRERREAEAAARAAEEANAQQEAVKYANSNLTEKESRRIADKILEVMADVETITSPEFTMERLADRIDVPYKYVSQVVNETLGKNFRSLLNEYRIKEACVRLADADAYGQVTIEHISETLGFQSRSNFSMTFKKITGITPAQFQKNALSEE